MSFTRPEPIPNPWEQLDRCRTQLGEIDALIAALEAKQHWNEHEQQAWPKRLSFWKQLAAYAAGPATWAKFESYYRGHAEAYADAVALLRNIRKGED